MQVSMKSYAKVNIFLKIAGKRDNYHEIVSRFVRVKNLYDEISFTPNNDTNEFNLIGNFGCKVEDNSIYKAFLELRKYCPKIDAFFRVYNIEVKKNIPEFAGLGGGSSNAASFLILANKHFNLYFKKNKLAKIGAKIGADVPFFIYEYDSANVTGIGEIVEEFKEESLNIEVVTPSDIKCHTGKIFNCFRDEFYKEITKDESKELLLMKSKDILNKLSIEQSNDLYMPAVTQYPALKEYAKKNWYFSGSGSSFFKVL
ncbi:4-(cytidine 5'-diphospho)-2-C-methyl-D-erythritol kinase [Malaciobacter molluscorum LMG 25693]|uniref:4-diphosphocytidyl-2-C-methyl-D-erythritol kinase n=1 Tax=Malaciobacter molluscorum LMG 25693 TaxID=870501 RepID=A0A2G1DKB4_9BACT|nr:4-(cytidine 5'-diphospho)-2-C-methyl-D-erythritol kinase [Malaciobacter molluscorum]AXX91309.1 4-diphosphocytidyl-2-C-methylerythritol kinase [Malaciobacter molluscorum LMG 25693]PHO18937.1 4-(cytidine 5'-diphospho)-2-C-methyl-D-erythritol kinase [Malaciobacter molluscorum LMG 25693]